LAKKKTAVCLNAGNRTIMFQEFLKCKIARTHVKGMKYSSTDCCPKVSDQPYVQVALMTEIKINRVEKKI
jgi:hypothetical protein